MMDKVGTLCNMYKDQDYNSVFFRGRICHERILVRFTTIYAISAYHHWCCRLESAWGVQYYVIKFVSDLRHATNTTDHHDITDILLKVALNAIKQTTVFLTPTYSSLIYSFMTYHRVYNKSNVKGARRGPQTVDSSGAHGFTSAFGGVFVICWNICLVWYCFYFVWGDIFVCRFSVSCMFNVTSISRLFIRDCPFSFLLIFIFFY